MKIISEYGWGWSCFNQYTTSDDHYNCYSWRIASTGMVLEALFSQVLCTEDDETPRSRFNTLFVKLVVLEVLEP